MAVISNNKKTKVYVGSKKVKKVFAGDNRVYSAGNICTYHVDGLTYREEVDEGESCLSPTSFIPEKSGYTFIGWSLESSGGDVLSDFIMGDTPVTLYAQWIATTLSVLSNPEYVTRSSGEWNDYTLYANAWVNRSGYHDRSTSDNTGYLTIKLGAYKKAIVVIKPDYNNSSAWYDTNPCRHGQVWINGVSVIASNTQDNRDSSPRTYTCTSNTTITLRTRAWINGNNGGAYTYVGANAAVQSVTLSM